MSRHGFWKSAVWFGISLAVVLRPVIAQAPSQLADVSVRTVDADEIRGRLAALSLDRGAVLHAAEEGVLRVPIADLVRVTLGEDRGSARWRARTSSRNDMVTLSSGDRVVGHLAGGNDTQIHLENPAFGGLHIPLEEIRHVRMARGFTPAYRESAEWFARSGRGVEDAVLLTNGDVISGFVTSISEETIGVDSGLGEARIEYRLVVAVRFAAGDTGPSGLPPQRVGPRLVVGLRDGSRLTADAFELVGSSAEARTSYGEKFSVDVARIAVIDVVGGRWEWLSDKRPVSEEQTPMLSLPWEYRKDRNVRGGPITVACRRYDSGIGVHSRSSLIYELKGDYRQFVTAFGLDDDCGRFADVDAFILVDGKRRFDKRHVTPGVLFGPVRVDVSQANRLELIVDYGANGDIQDRFNWVEAALIRNDAAVEP